MPLHSQTVDIFLALIYGCGLLSPLLLLASLYVRYYRTHKLSYPPGPPETSLLLGNRGNLPDERPWLAYIEWANLYKSDILHFRNFTEHTVILNDYEDNVELLERRSRIYSDRPILPMMDLMGWTDLVIAFMRYGQSWRRNRRIADEFLRPKALVRHQSIQVRKVLDFLWGLLNTPDDFTNHYQTLPAAVVMSSMYGIEVVPKDDYFVGLADRALSRLSEVALPGNSLLHAFPILKYIPTWFPGAHFKRHALEGKKYVMELRDIPLDFVLKQTKEGMAPHCVATDLLQTCDSKERFEAIRDTVATTYAAGAHTLVSALGTFFLAMACFPDAQRKAQEEIDAVIGSKRIINWDDRPSLKYVEALYREVLRWQPVLPLSVFHAAEMEDVYKGYYIPKGATVISNIWAISRDTKKYSEPEAFNPDRFFDEEGKLNGDTVDYAFGFGRRICVGKHMASNTAWLALAATLQNFTIAKKKDSNGADVPITGEYTDGLIILPLPFDCSVTCRSSDARTNIMSAASMRSEQE